MKKVFVLVVLMVAALMAACSETTEPITEQGDTGGDVLAGGPGEGDGVDDPLGGDTPDNEPGPTLVEEPDWTFLSDVEADEILVQLDIEPSFTLPEYLQEFSRIPRFTLFADGRVFYEQAAGAESFNRNVMTAQLSAEEVEEVMSALWEAGYGRIDTWEDMCAPGEGDTPCIADAPYTIISVRTAADNLRTTRHYANFASDMAALDNVTDYLNQFSAENAEVYANPPGATLLLRSGEGNNADPLTWPLEGINPAEQVSTEGNAGIVALNAEQAATLIASLDFNAGAGVTQAADGSTIAFEIVPWLPGQNYEQAIAEYNNR